jgi:hypothetical protein
MDEQRSHAGDGHLRFFFPPVVLAGAREGSARIWKARCDDANQPSRESRIHRARIPLWPTEYPPRSSIVPHAPGPTLTTVPLPAHTHGDTSALALGPAIFVLNVISASTRAQPSRLRQLPSAGLTLRRADGSTIAPETRSLSLKPQQTEPQPGTDGKGKLLNNTAHSLTASPSCGRPPTARWVVMIGDQESPRPQHQGGRGLYGSNSTTHQVAETPPR